VFQSLDQTGSGKLSKKRLKSLVLTYAGGCELLESDLQAVIRRLDADGDGDVSFSDFFNRLLPYFVYAGYGSHQSTELKSLKPGAKGPVRAKRSMSSIHKSVQHNRKRSLTGHLRGSSEVYANQNQSIFDRLTSQEDTEQSLKKEHKSKHEQHMDEMRIPAGIKR
jgi:EF-hand domain pair